MRLPRPIRPSRWKVRLGGTRTPEGQEVRGDSPGGDGPERECISPSPQGGSKQPPGRAGAKRPPSTEGGRRRNPRRTGGRRGCRKRVRRRIPTPKPRGKEVWKPCRTPTRGTHGHTAPAGTPVLVPDERDPRTPVVAYRPVGKHRKPDRTDHPAGQGAAAAPLRKICNLFTTEQRLCGTTAVSPHGPVCPAPSPFGGLEPGRNRYRAGVPKAADGLIGPPFPPQGGENLQGCRGIHGREVAREAAGGQPAGTAINKPNRNGRGTGSYEPPPVRSQGRPEKPDTPWERTKSQILPQQQVVAFASKTDFFRFFKSLENWNDFSLKEILYKSAK